MADSETHFTTLWDYYGGYMDTLGTKHTWPVRDVIAEGNYRSSWVDRWDNATFHTVSQTMNLMKCVIKR